MADQPKYHLYFSMSSALTNRFPRLGAGFLNKLVPLLLSNDLIIQKNLNKDLEVLRQVESFRKILVISDLNIGDAVNLQSSISALRQFFPEAIIDYVITRLATGLISGNPEISRVFPVFSGQAIPTETDQKKLYSLIKKENYDVIFNFCPLFEDSIFGDWKSKTIHYTLLASRLIRNEKAEEEINHVSYQAFLFIDLLLSAFHNRIKKKIFHGVRITLKDMSIREAQLFLLENNLYENGVRVFYNPDTSSKFTRIPIKLQVDLIKKIVELTVVDSILLGAGHKERGIEKEILESIPLQYQKKVTIVPSSMPIDSYAALIDFADIFITGDTGPLHIAAARKISQSGNYDFKNKTAVLSIWGATPSRIYGYDSSKEGYFPANQNAPSRAFVAESPCRNITCINKMAKTCKRVRCFESLNIFEIREMVNSILRKHRPMKISVQKNKIFQYNNWVRQTQ